MKIGDFFLRDHSTVMASVKHIHQSIESDHKEIGGACHAISKKLQYIGD
jgi:chromosomal replication initiation ATPase DnaA